MQKKVPENTGRRGLRQRIFAWMYSRSSSSEEMEIIDYHKRQIFPGLHGEVLEIGPGTGDSLTYFPSGIRWIGVEPNRYMHAHLREAMDRAGFASVEVKSFRTPVPVVSPCIAGAATKAESD
jgi:predicted O-methyltransferase YrrM